MPDLQPRLRERAERGRAKRQRFNNVKADNARTPVPGSCEPSLGVLRESTDWFYSSVYCSCSEGNRDLGTDVPKWEMPP